MERHPHPKRWVSVTLDDIAEVRLGRQRSPKRAHGPHMTPYLRAANVTWLGISLTDLKQMDFTPQEREVYALQDGDILLAEASGSASGVGKPAIWREQLPLCCFQNTLIRVRAPSELVSFLHTHFLKDALTGAFARASRGVGIHHLGAKALSQWRVALPPLVEQRRIVEALDSFFTRLDDAIATLERVQANLKRYRASVLKAAVEGRLVPTEAELARKQGGEYEPASELLKRILVERRRRWEEAELAKMEAKGKPPKNDKWKAKYKEPAAPNTSSLPELPEGWCWTTLDQLSHFTIDYRGKTPPSASSGVPIISAANVKRGRIVFDRPRYVSTETYREFAVRGMAEPGDLVVTTEAPVGEVAVYPEGGPFLLTRRVIGFQTAHVDNQYLGYCFSSASALAHIKSHNRGSTVPRILKPALMRTPLALPPQEEQARIRERVEALLSTRGAVRAQASDSQARVRRLRQSILKWAFEGKLVDQDPSDEPASVLLERMKAERPAAAEKKPKKRARRKKKAKS